MRMCGAASVRSQSQICFMISGGRSRPGSPCSGSSGVSSRWTANWSLSLSAGPPGLVPPSCRAAVSSLRTSRQASTRVSSLIWPAACR